MWKTVKLGELLDVQNGYEFNSKQFSSEGEIPLIRIRDLKAGMDTKTRYTGEYDAKYIVKKGDLLIGIDGEFRCYEWKGVNALLNQRVCRLQNFKGNLYERYLLYVINNQLKKIEDVTGFTTVKHLSSTTIKEINLVLPPLTEQQRIVAKLDAAFAEIDTAIDAANAQINNIAMLRKRILNGWIEKNASPEDYCTVQDCIDKEWLKQPFDGNHGEIHPKASDYTATGVPFIMARDLSNGEVNLTECKFISHEQAASLRVGFAKNNDLLFTHKGTIGEVALLECQADFVMLTPQVTAYRVIDESRIDRLFLYYLFKSIFFQSQIQQIAGIGTTRAYIGITRQKQLSLCLPSIELQQQAVSVLKNSEPYVSTIGFANKNKLEQLLRLKSAILAQELQSEAA